ncbi:MAG: hypothetical protein ACI9R3_001448 [Verrucomicrobiales bacterium]|jgi:hypothetical protein
MLLVFAFSAISSGCSSHAVRDGLFTRSLATPEFVDYVRGRLGRMPFTHATEKGMDETHTSDAGQGDSEGESEDSSDNPPPPSLESLKGLTDAQSGGNETDVARTLRKMIESIDESIRHVDKSTEDQFARREDVAFKVLNDQKQNLYAALVRYDGENSTISRRFGTQQSLESFLRATDAIVDTWAHTPGDTRQPRGFAGRRLSSSELSKREREGNGAPTFTVVISRDLDSGDIRRERLEFGRVASLSELQKKRSYHRHRHLRWLGREILHARNASGCLSAEAQWQALGDVQTKGTFKLEDYPEPPVDDSDLFVAVEYEVGLEGENYTAPIRLYRSGDVTKGVIDGVQYIHLHSGESEGSRFGLGFHLSGETGAKLVAAAHPIAGQDVVEVRLFDKDQSDERRWNILDFGEPEIARERGLANFGLLQGYLEKHQKHRALKKANIDIVAETIFVGLDIGGGINGSPQPLGDSARLGYNVLVAPWFLRRLPKPEEYPILARQLNAGPEVDGNLASHLHREDLRYLSARFGRMAEHTLADTLNTVDRHDLRATVKLARGQSVDGKYRLLANVLTSVGKATKESESSILKTIFNNSRLAPNGELSIKNTLAWAFGNETITPLSGVSLESLADGGGPKDAWWQFLDLSLDLRAVANSFSLFRNRGRVDRELLRPFPHAPLMRDLSAYEIRGFGFPGLIFHKRKLVKQDIAAYRNDFAYAVIGARIVKHFETREAFETAIRAGTMTPMGFVSVADESGDVRQSNLPVFGHHIAEGKHKGKFSLVLFGLEAFRSYSQFMEREHDRLWRFEDALVHGGVIEGLSGGTLAALPEREAVIYVGETAVQERYVELLDKLLEYRRFIRLREWGAELTSTEILIFERLRDDLRDSGVAIDHAKNPLIKLNPKSSMFVYEQSLHGRTGQKRVTLIPSLKDIERALRQAEDDDLIERSRRLILRNGSRR